MVRLGGFPNQTLPLSLLNQSEERASATSRPVGDTHQTVAGTGSCRPDSAGRFRVTDPRATCQAGTGLNLHIRGAKPAQRNCSRRCASNRQLSERRLAILVAKGVPGEAIRTGGRGSNVTLMIIAAGSLIICAVNAILVNYRNWAPLGN